MILAETITVNWFFAIAAGVAIVFGVISNAIKVAKIKKSQGKKPPIQASTAPESKESSADKSPDEQWDKIVKKMEAQKAASNPHRDAKKRDKNQKNSASLSFDSRKKVSFSDDTGSQHKSETVKKVTERQLHIHPGERVGSDQMVRIEKKPVSTGSLGVDNDEGCEHNDMRFILEDIGTGDDNVRGDMKELQRLIVWGEILDTPRSKSKKIR